MKLFTFFATVATSMLMATSRVAAEGASEKWTYKTNDSELHGPESWSELFPACQGTRQSPIDISVMACNGKKQTVPFTFGGECSEFHIKQKYESFKAEAIDGSCTATVNDETYSFAQVHYHAPSEHTLGGKTLDGEVHFVHTLDEKILVVGLFLEKSADCVTDPFVSTFWDGLLTVNSTSSADAELPSYFSLLEDRMAAGRVFNYPGGLTTPTCDEVVDWWVIQEPLAVAEADFEDFQSTLKHIGAADDGRNARPTQALNGRSITVY